MENSPPKWLLLIEAADRSRISRHTLERLIREGRGPKTCKAGERRLVVDVDDLDAWIRGKEASHAS